MWEPGRGHWFVIHAFGPDVKVIAMTREVMSVVGRLPIGRRLVHFRKGKYVYGDRGARLDAIYASDTSLRARSVRGHTYEDTEGVEHDDWWEIDCSPVVGPSP
jgi:hypothetical protein